MMATSLPLGRVGRSLVSVVALFLLVSAVVNAWFDESPWGAVRLAGLLYLAGWLGQNWSALPRMRWRSHD